KALRPRGIRRGTHTCQLGEGRQVTEARITRRADHRGAEVPLPAVHAREERRELELPDGDVEAHGGQSGLNHLLERPFAAPDGEQLEGDAPAAQQPAGGGRGRGDRAGGGGTRDVPGGRARGGGRAPGGAGAGGGPPPPDPKRRGEPWTLAGGAGAGGGGSRTLA